MKETTIFEMKSTMYKFGPIRSVAPLSPRPEDQRLSTPVYNDGYTEPALSEVLDDPIVHSVMARDAVTRESLAELISRTQKGLLSRQHHNMAHRQAA